MFLIVIVNDSGAILTVEQGSWLIVENDDTYMSSSDEKC